MCLWLFKTSCVHVRAREVRVKGLPLVAHSFSDDECLVAPLIASAFSSETESNPGETRETESKNVVFHQSINAELLSASLNRVDRMPTRKRKSWNDGNEKRLTRTKVGILILIRHSVEAIYLFVPIRPREPQSYNITLIGSATLRSYGKMPVRHQRINLCHWEWL